MNLRIGPSLAGRLSTRAVGRVVVIDAFRTWNCGTWVGDVTARWAAAPPSGAFVASGSVDGVPVFVAPTLSGLLERAGPSLHRGGPLHRGGLRVELDRPELWITWLDRPDAWRSDGQDPAPRS